MRRLLQVSWHEFWKMIGKRSFWLGMFAFPLLMIFLFVGVFFVALVLLRDQAQVVGYVDNAGVLLGESSGEGTRLEIRPYPNEAAARQALEKEEIDTYYIFPADYRQTQQVAVYVRNDPPTTLVTDNLRTFLRPKLLAELDQPIRQRILDGADISLQVIGKDEDAMIRTLIKGGLMMLAMFAIVIVMGDVAGYASTIVEDERKNRTLEMMVTTLTPNQFIIGKIIGLVGVTITRPLMWLLMVSPFVFLLFSRLPATYRQMIDFSFIFLIFLFIIPGITLFFALMTIASVIIADPRYSGQMASLLSIILSLSFFMAIFVVMETNNPAVIFFSFFPLTSFMVIVMRQVMVAVPVWQIALSWFILVGSTGVSLWLAAYFFRTGRYFSGRPFAWRSIWQKTYLWIRS